MSKIFLLNSGMEQLQEKGLISQFKGNKRKKNFPQIVSSRSGINWGKKSKTKETGRNGIKYFQYFSSTWLSCCCLLPIHSNSVNRIYLRLHKFLLEFKSTVNWTESEQENIFKKSEETQLFTMLLYALWH